MVLVLLLPTRGSAVVLTPSIFVLGSAPPGLAARYPAALPPRRDCSISLLEKLLCVFVCIERGVLCHVFGQSKGGRVVMGVRLCFVIIINQSINEDSTSDSSPEGD